MFTYSRHVQFVGVIIFVTACIFIGECDERPDEQSGSADTANSVCRQPPSDVLARRRRRDIVAHHLFGRSEVTALPGHWPAGYCRITNVFLMTSTRTFYVGVDNPLVIDRCYGTRDIWNFTSKRSVQVADAADDVDGTFTCDQVYDLAHVFTMYYYHGSNYFHLHFDTAVPLYHSLWYKQVDDPDRDDDDDVTVRSFQRLWTPINVKSTVLMPAVEIDRGKGVDWQTDAFFNDSAYWNELLQIIVQPYQLLPLDARLAAIDKTLCFKEILFGTPKIDVSNASMIQSFAAFIKAKLNIPHTAYTTPVTKIKQMGLIERKGRRKILNDNQLLEALQAIVNVELVDFVDRSLEDQVEMMQKYDILAGINGAGLTNAIYLPTKSVAIQMIPFQAQHLNHIEYRKLLQARGPYMEWQNNHSELNRLVPDQIGNIADTLVQVDEFVSIIKDALKLLN